MSKVLQMQPGVLSLPFLMDGVTVSCVREADAGTTDIDQMNMSVCDILHNGAANLKTV